MEKKKSVQKMNNKNCFFLTNDDGYRAVGLKFLKKVVKQVCNDIWVFAPSKNQSAKSCLLYTSPSPRDATLSRMPSSA